MTKGSPTKPFQIKLTDGERLRLDQHRAAMGLRSQADAIRTLIAQPIKPRPPA